MTKIDTKDLSYKPYFKSEELERNDDSLVVCSGNVSKSKIPCTAQMIYMPKDLSEKLKKHLVGQLSPAVVGILEHMLNYLEENNKTLLLKKSK